MISIARISYATALQVYQFLTTPMFLTTLSLLTTILLACNVEEVNGEKEATSKDANWEAFMDEWDDLMDRVGQSVEARGENGEEREEHQREVSQMMNQLKKK